MLHIPAVQTSLAQYASKKFSEAIDFKINIERVNISWFDQVVLDQLSVHDENNKLLFKAKDVEINYDLVSIIREDLRINHAIVDSLNFNLEYHLSDTLNITVFINRIKALSEQQEGQKTHFRVDHIELHNSSFHYLVDDSKLKSQRFNYRNFKLNSINGYLNSLEIKPDTFQINVSELTTINEGTDTKINKLRTNFLVSSKGMRFDSLDLALGRSALKGDIVFHYNDYAGLANFVEDVEMEASIDRSLVKSSDLRLFAGYFDKILDTYQLRGDYRGEIADFKVRNLDLSFGSGSSLTGSFDFEGLPNIYETFIDINLRRSHIIENDLEQYIPAKSFSEYNRFNEVSGKGNFTGYIDDFVANGKFETNLGTIVSDINLKIDPQPENSSYSGKLELIEFELGDYSETQLIGKASLKGAIKGSGLSLLNANFEFDGLISSIGVNNYEYTGIETNGHFINQYFKGSLIVDDPNLKLNTIGEIDLRESRSKVILNGKLEFAHPDKLNLIDNISYVRTDIQANVQGMELDSINGFLYLENVIMENQTNELEIEHLTLSSFLKEGLREIELITERANVKVSGDFSYLKMFGDISYMVKEYGFNLLNKSDSLDQFYAQNPPLLENGAYTVNLEARLGNIDRFLQLFYPQISLHGKTDISAHYKHSERNILSTQILNDSLTVNNLVFLNNQLNFDGSKVIGKNEILAAADVQSQYQITEGGAILENLILSAVWANENIDFNWYNTYPEIKNTNDIYGHITFFRDSTEIHLDKSQIDILDEKWTLQDNNLVTIIDKEIKVGSLNVGSDDQMITANGVIGEDIDDILAITVNNFDLSLLNPLLPENLSGHVSGEFALSSLYATPTVVSNFYIGDLYIDQFLVGDIFSSNDWNNDRNLFDIQFLLSRNNTPIILVSGIFNPFDPQNALDLDARFMNAKLNFVEPFVETLFSNIKGNINGKIHVSGPLGAPVLTGNGTLHGAGLKINYLNTNYNVQGQWAFDSTRISLSNMIIRDRNQNTGVLNGEFTHAGFRDFRINLQGNMNDFMVLNTTTKDNDLFYGTGIATGSVLFTGPLNDITIKVQAKTERGTRFYIPIGGSETTEFEDYITFVDFSDSLSMGSAAIKNNKDLKITGLNLEFDLDITDEAYSEIIFDITSGDIIRGRGNGHISMNIDTNGEFTMIGSYEFTEGGYNFTMYNIVNKEFVINPKSRITWTGDPYGGIMDIDASYKVITSLEPLIDTTYHDHPDVKRLYPAEVLLGLKGPLLTPDIEFQIIIDEYPKSNAELDTQIKAFLNTIALDQQELNRQVFSLLILRKFSTPNSFSSSATIGSSVSEFVSNQLSYWISQVDDNLTIDMDLGDLDADALKAFQLRVSYEFMDGKLIVTRDGGFTDPNNEASVESIAGDWTLEYLLSDDGRLRVKLFNKTNYNQLNSTTGSDNQALISGGFSLIYTTSFNSFSDLFKRKKPKKEKKGKETTSSALKPEDNQAIKPDN